MLDRREGGSYSHLATENKWVAWQASRAAIEINLPESWYDEYMDHVVNYDETVEVIRAAGIKVKE
ncbi:hypothetical protein [Enterobacter phage SDFMU_Pec]|uniref:Uncharacterized protein n=1 Tax=Enterobacter phage SDFMU_Pec TaxID=3076136 RepID=A0AA96KQV6_9CAUD|nr:hypothetical protein [Enterobacter phage SDFMU_Pec]